MARLLFGGDSVDVRGAAGTAILSASGFSGVVYLDAAGTQPADISLTANGSSVVGSVITDTDYSLIPDFWGPADATSVLYVRVNGGPTTRIEARTSQQVATGDASTLATATARAVAMAIVLGA